jgi:hypothetical protein
MKAWYTYEELEIEVQEHVRQAVEDERARIVKIIQAEQRRSECIRRINSGE